MSAYRPKEVADQLGLSAPTLRRWSDKFEEFLSPSAATSTAESGGSAQRRYSDEDVQLFRKVQRLLNSGKTYEETHRALQDGAGIDFEQEIDSLPKKPAPSSTPAIVEASEHPAIQIFREALIAKEQTIEALSATVEAKNETIESLTAALVDKDALVVHLQGERDRLLEGANMSASEAFQQTKALIDLVEKMTPSTTTSEKPWWKKIFG